MSLINAWHDLLYGWVEMVLEIYLGYDSAQIFVWWNQKGEKKDKSNDDNNTWNVHSITISLTFTTLECRLKYALLYTILLYIGLVFTLFSLYCWINKLCTFPTIVFRFWKFCKYFWGKQTVLGKIANKISLFVGFKWKVVSLWKLSLGK